MSDAKEIPRFRNHEEFLFFIKRETGAATYLEIGVDAGRTIFQNETELKLAVGVDPDFKIVTALEQPSRVALLRKTSDEFFADGDYARMSKKAVDLTFVDGLHNCEVALRDVLNAERLSHKRSIILVHDIVPGNAAEAGRKWQAGNWMGDVFRTALALKRFRADLDVLLVGDVPPSGMAIVTALKPRAKSIDLAEAEAFMMAIDFDKDFDRLVRPQLISTRGTEFASFIADANGCFRPKRRITSRRLAED